MLVDKNKSYTTLAEIPIGDVFEIGDRIFMRIDCLLLDGEDRVNAVQLDDASVHYVNPGCAVVYHPDAKVVI